jgi:predicted nucleotidyltransferase
MTLDIPLDKIAEICRRRHIVELAIFGSAARGEMRADSDVDVVVEFEAGVVYGLEYFGLELELAELFGRRVDLATKKWLKPKLRAEVLREARVVYAA